MPIDVTCACGKRFAVQERYAGKKGKCPACGKSLSVPEASEPDPALDALAESEPGTARTVELKAPAPEPKRTCFGCGAEMPAHAILCTRCGRSTLGSSVTTTINDPGEQRGPRWFNHPLLRLGDFELTPLKLALVGVPLAALLIYYFTGPARPALVRSAQAVRVIDALDRGATRDQYSLYTGTGDRSLGYESGLANSSQGNVSTDTDALTFSVGGSDGLVVTRPDAGGDALLVRLGLRQSKVRAVGATSGYDSVLSASDFRLVPDGGGDAIPARLLYADFLQPAAYIDLAGAATSGVGTPLPPDPPTRYNEQIDKASVRAVAVYEGDTRGTVRLSASRSYDGAPAANGVLADGHLRTTHPDDPGFIVEHDYQSGTLAVSWDPADTGHWEMASFKRHSAMSPWKRYELALLFEPGTGRPAAGRYQLRYRDEPLATVTVKAQPPPNPATPGNNAGPAKPGRPPGVSPIKRAQGTPSNRQINPNNPLAYFDILLESRDQARGIVSANNLRQLGFGLRFYADDHGGELPDTLDQIEPYLPGLAALLSNPRTGENPGFIYEKPAPGADPSTTVVVWESLNGQKDPDGAMLYADGGIR